jgi:small conductance mechanosensitive channel
MTVLLAPLAILLTTPASGGGRLLPDWFSTDPEAWGVLVVRLALTAVAALIAQRALFFLVWRIETWLIRASRGSVYGVQRAKTIRQLLRNVITTVVVAWAVIHGLDVLGWDVKPLLVGASILGAALGFGGQFLVRDVIAGTFIFIEDQFVVGDTIEVNGTAATVEEVTLRSTRLRDFQGREMHVPNGEMKIVVNHSRGWQRAVVDLPVAPGQDLALALRLAETVARELNADRDWKDLLLEPFEVMGFERTGADGSTMRIVGRARPGGDAPRLSRELRLRVLQRWKDGGIRTALDPLVASRPAPAPAPPPET